MTCPSCKNLMCNVDEKYECPACKGEFFTSEQTADEVDLNWFVSKLLYPAAMRNEKEVRRHDYKHGFLRNAGRQREEFESSLYIR